MNSNSTQTASAHNTAAENVERAADVFRNPLFTEELARQINPQVKHFKFDRLDDLMDFVQEFWEDVVDVHIGGEFIVAVAKRQS